MDLADIMQRFIVIGITDNPKPWFPPEVLEIIRNGKVFSGGKRHHEIVAPLLPEGAEWIDITVPLDDVFERLGGNLDGKGPGAMRRIPQEDLDQLKAIFDITGATDRMENVRKAGEKKAAELGMTVEEFTKMVYTQSDPKHLNH